MARLSMCSDDNISTKQNCSMPPAYDMPDMPMMPMGFTIDMELLECTKDCFIITIISILGIILNPLCAIALSRDRVKFPTTFLLQALAAADTLFLFSNFLSLSLPCWLRGFALKPSKHANFLYFEHIVYVVLEIFRDYAVWMVVILTINRYLGIYYPLRAIHLNRKAIFAKTIGALLFCIGFNIPKIFERGVTYVINDKNQTVPQSRGLLTKDAIYTSTYFFVDTVVNVLIPILVVSSLNMRMIKVVRNAWNKRFDLSGSYRADQERSNRTTLMLVIIALVFIMCELPHAIFLMAKVIIEPYPGQTALTFSQLQLLILLSDISTIFQNLNSMANFFVYYLLGKVFRRILRDMCCSACINCRLVCTPFKRARRTWTFQMRSLQGTKQTGTDQNG